METILSQSIHLSNHHNIHFKYLTMLFNYASIQLIFKKKNNNEVELLFYLKLFKVFFKAFENVAI